MGNLKGKTVLVVTAKILTHYREAAALASILLSAPDAHVLDIQGVLTGDIDTAIGLLTANYYSDVIILCPVSSGGSTSVLSYDQLVALRLKLLVANRGTSILTSAIETSGSNSTSVAYLGASASAVLSYYNGLYLSITAGTHVGVIKKILSYAITSKLATIGGAVVSGAFDNTDTYQILYAPHFQVVQDPALFVATAYLYDTVVPALNLIATTWNYNHDLTEKPLPLFLNYLAQFNSAKYTATASAGGNTTLTYGTGGFGTDSRYVGMYVYISSGTGAGQWAQIASHTDTVLTCAYFNGTYVNTPYGNAAWTTNPSSDSVFYIVATYDRILARESAQLYTKTFLLDPTSGTAIANWKRLIDADGKLDTRHYGASVYDPDYLALCLADGYAIYEALRQSVTLT